MGFNVGSGKKRTPEMNVTPLVDVVLVLLIIFMVVTPLLMREFWTHLPKQEKKEVQQSSKGEEPLVLQVLRGERILINKTEIPIDQLPEKLKRMPNDLPCYRKNFYFSNGKNTETLLYGKFLVSR